MTEPVQDAAILFARDPEKMSDADINAIVEKYRSSRHLFQNGASPAKGAKPKLTPTESKVTAALSGLNLKLNL